MAEVEVRAVRTTADRRAFIDLPFRLHSNGTPWVPPLRLERHAYLNRRLNAFFRHGDAELYLAYRDGRLVGRISAQVDERYRDRSWGNFGFLEAEDDPEVFAALLAAAERWVGGRGCERLVGPMDFTMNDECGVLIKGFDRQPLIKQPWHPPYYARHCEAAGLAKAVDLLMWELDITDREKMLPILPQLADAATTEHGVTIRKMTRRTLRTDLDTFGEIYNRAWRKNWGFVPFGKEDLDHYAQELHLVFDSDWFMVAEKDGEAIAAAITVPDVNQVLDRMGGRLLPLGWLTFLRRRSLMDRCRVGFLGVRPEFQHTGVAALLYMEHFRMAEEGRITRGDTGWILETNTAMNRGMEAMNGRVAKKYRMYERVLAGTS